MASAIVNPLIAAEPFEEAVDGPRSPTSEKEMQLFYEEQERQDMQRRLSKRNSRTKSWRRSFARTNSGKNGQESLRSPSPTVASPPTAFRSPPPSAVPLSSPATPGPGVGAFSRKPPGRRSTSPSTPMPLPVHVVRDQSHIPWHLRKYEIYQPPAFGARAPPRYLNHHLLSASARERLQRELAASYAAGRVPLPSLTTSVAYSGVGSGMGGSVRSSLSVRRPSFLASSNLGGSAGLAGLETITASPASTAAPLNSPSLDPTSALNNGPAASHRFSTWLKRPPASPHTSTQPLPADATDAMDGTDPFGSMWHHSSPYDAGEMVGRGFVRPRDSSAPETPHGRPSMLSPTAGPSRKGPSPLSQSASAINLTDSEPPLPDPPGSPDLLSGTRTTRKLSKRRSTSATRGGLSSLFTRKTSIDDESPVDSPRGGLRGRSRPPLSPSSLSLAQTQGIAFPTSPHDGREKRPRRKLSKRGRSGSMSSAASVDSIADRQSIETPIHTQFARDLPDARGRDVEIVELPSAKFPARTPSTKPLPQPRARAPSQHHHTSSAPEPSYSAPPVMGYGPPPPSTTTNKPHRERKISAASVSSFLSRITSRDKDKDLPRATSAQETDRKVAPHMLLNHVGKRKGERGSVFGRIARKLSLIRRRSVDAIGVEANESRPSFTVERRGGIQPPTLQRRATLDLPSRTPTFKQPAPQPQSPPSKGPELFAPIDPQLRTSRLINASLSPPPRIPDLALAGDRGSWASLARHVSNAKPREDLEPLAPPPPLNPDGPKHPDSPQSIPRWGIANADKGPGLIMNGSPTDDSPMSLPKPVLTIANPDESEGESLRRGSGKIARESIFVRESGVSVGDQLRMRALPPDPPVEMSRGRESVKPLVVRKSRSRTPSPVKPTSGRESPVKRTGRESPVKRTGRESPVKKSGRESPVKPSGRESPSKRRPRRDHSPVKPVRRTEPLKDHSAMGVGSPGMSLRTSAAMGSTTSVDAIQGDDETEFGARPTDANGRVLKRSQPSMDSIGKVHVINPKTSLQKIRVRVVSNPPPVEIAKESSPVKEDPPKLAPSPEPAEPSQRPSRSKSRPRSGYTTGREHSVYGTAASDSTDSIASPVGPRKRISVADPTMSPLARNKGSPAMSPEMRSHMHAKSASADLKSATPYMTPTDEHAPLHPFSDKPVEYHSMAPISVMHVETSMPTFPKSDWSKADLKAGLYDSKPSTSDAKPGFSFTDSKGGWMDDEVDLPPPKAPFMNEEFSVSKEKLAAQGEFKKHSRESTAESGRRVRDEREAEMRKAERALQRERERVERERIERERAERERLERERAEQERLERERIERERAERERLRQEARAERQREQERLERERLERERAEQERMERERLELERFEREQAEKAKERAERERQRAIRRQREAELEQERERERIKDMERQARERDRERVEKERLERERQELERERIERERAEAARAEWERVERERLERERAERAERAERERVERECIERERLEEEMRRREQPPPLLHSHTGSSSVRRTRHDVDGEREVHVVTMKELRKSKRRTPNDSRSTSPTSTAPPPPPKDDRPFKSRQRSQTDVTYTIPITSAIPPPPAQPSMEVIAGVPVLPQGTHVEVAQPFHVRPTSENTIDAPLLKAREAWERDRLDKAQSVLGPGGQRAVIPDIGSPRPAPDPRQRQASSSKIRSQTGPVMHSEPYVLSPVQIHANSAGNVHDYGTPHVPHPTSPTFPAARAHHNPLPKPPTIDGPYPLHRPGRAYNNPNRQPGPGQNRSRNPLPEPPRVSSYPLHHNVSPPRGVPPGAVR